MRTSLLPISIATALVLVASSGSAQQDVGLVEFANSGSAAAQESFLRGLALLHNFEYSSAAESFRQAQTVDPGFALAYWGEAMTYNHPLWAQQDLPAATATLARLAPTAALRLAKAPTPRERDYLHAVEVLYGTGTKEERDFDYADAMAALHAKYSDDVDATAFDALAILGTAHQGRDFSIYMRSAALLEEVLPGHLRHPGVLHYLIHSYDDPAHAPLGLRAARRYGAVAPNAGHALHMTSHIFLALGMWDETVSANRRAMEVVNAQRAAKTLPPRQCGHYISWLHYALLQERRLDEAKQVLDACRAQALAAPASNAKQSTDADDSDITGFAEMRLFDLVDAGHWNVADSREIAARSSVRARFDSAYGDALWSLRGGGDPQEAADRVTALRAARDGLLATLDLDKVTDAGNRARPDLMTRQIEGLVLLRSGKAADGLAVLDKVAREEGALPNAFGPPEIQKPSYELLGEELLAAGRTDEAGTAFRAALARAPGRTTTLQHLLAVHQKRGDAPAIAATQQILDHCLHGGTP
ncbi:MAG: hypothetical protein ABI609_09540 [Acidobacteriota bacterium]